MGRRSRAPRAACLGRLWGVGGSSSRGDRSRVTWPTSHLGPNRQAGPRSFGDHRWPASTLRSCQSSCKPVQAFARLFWGCMGVGGWKCASMLLIASPLCGCKSTCPRYDHLPGYEGAVPSFGWRHNQQRRVAAWDGRRCSKAVHIVMTLGA